MVAFCVSSFAFFYGYFSFFLCMQFLFEIHQIKLIVGKTQPSITLGERNMRSQRLIFPSHPLLFCLFQIFSISNDFFSEFTGVFFFLYMYMQWWKLVLCFLVSDSPFIEFHILCSRVSKNFDSGEGYLQYLSCLN